MFLIHTNTNTNQKHDDKPTFFSLEKENTRGMTETVKPQVLTVCLNPTLQRDGDTGSTLQVGDVNRATSVLTTASGKGVNVARVLEQLGVCALHLCQAHAAAPTAARFLALAAADGGCASQPWTPAPDA